ncbi:unnamed protein product [Brugia timori]|uniref:Uncharacterized protein n=1 Tax=Brugia timori TaxID=42155 RepID=A0A0R3QCB8_9BILA|nr:unnamed protein product [Brugia timori]
MLKIESTGQLGAAIVVSVCEDERSGKQALSSCDHESGGSNDDIDSIGSDCNDNISKIYGDINKSLKKAAVTVTVEPFTFFSSSNDLVLHGILIVEILLQ